MDGSNLDPMFRLPDDTIVVLPYIVGVTAVMKLTPNDPPATYGFIVSVTNGTQVFAKNLTQQAASELRTRLTEAICTWYRFTLQGRLAAQPNINDIGILT